MPEIPSPAEVTENVIIPTDAGQVAWIYAPSSIEKKRAVMMYMLFGVIIAISNKKVNSFEFFHLKQAIWRRLCFILVVIAAIVLMLIPGIKYLGLLALLAMVAIFIVLAKQARGGKYHTDMKKYWFLGLFPSLGARLVNLFEISPKEDNAQTTPTVPSEQLTTNSEQWIANIQPPISGSTPDQKSN